DKNNLHGAVEFAKTAAEAGIKPIIGAELDWHGHRLCLYVQNQTGYTNLCRILNAASTKTPSSASKIFPGHARNRSSVSPHPAPLPRGEGKYSPVSRRIERGYNKPERTSLFPLPWGEGQGEGEETMNNLQHTHGLLAVSPAAELAQFFPDRFYLEINS